MYDCGKVCLILIPFRLPEISCFALSLKCFSSDSDNCPNVGIRPLLQFPNPLRAGPVLATLLFFPLVLSSIWVFLGSIYSFLLIRYSCSLSTGVLHACTSVSERAFLMCPWREIHVSPNPSTPGPPTPPPSCSLVGRFLIAVLISLLVIGLFRLCIYSWFIFGMLHFSKNLSISSKFSILLAYSCHSCLLWSFVVLCCLLWFFHFHF